ncbi:MAG: SDR family NAD(P)-dependent oxidoreductase [Acidimicrobiia bacterium]|nr:SDR family NAD(P)-dependent oxidoreductase [Acidimicrobiia bacterium]
MDLANAHVVVTGASRGIGRELVEVLADRGARLALVARSRDALDALVREIGDERAAAFPCDLADSVAIDGLIDRIEATRGPIDVLVNNAGLDHTGAFTAMTAAQLRAVIEVNLIATAELCRQVLPGMTRRGHGHVVNVSSIAGSLPSAGVIAYCATKAGVNQFTAGLRAELKHTGIGTTLVEIGPAATQMMDHLRDYEPTAKGVRRLERLGLAPELDPRVVATAMADAITARRRHLRMPKRQAPISAIAELPRRIGSLVTLGLKTAPR